jgi:hypothetical protein
MIPSFPMHKIRPQPLLYRSLSWLVWLAMLLPAAQSAATWHAYSHGLQDASGQQEDRQAPHSDHCSLCLTAAGMSGGALLATPPSLPDSAARFELPQFAAGDVWLAPATLAYLSRAPPASPI